MAIEEIVAGLQEQGLNADELAKALAEMLEKGEITQEDYDKALAMIAEQPAEELPEQEENEEEKMARVFGNI